jgi:DNA-directed RNA polymerase subunit RPC12/RpoP
VSPEHPCPHCGSAVTDLWDYSWAYGEDEDIETECGTCEHPIIIQRRMSTSYTIKAARPHKGKAQ